MDSSSVQELPALSTLQTVLNAPQLEAVTHATGPLLVLAGAGSGKTRVITFRIAHLLAEAQVPPYRILAVTFTNKAAMEMRERLQGLVGPDITRDLWVGTFHATCARLLRRYAESAGLAKDFLIYDDSDQRSLMGRVLKALNIDDKQYPAKAFLSAIHAHKQHGRGPKDLSEDSPYDSLLVRVYEAFQEALRTANAVDFDDLILHILHLAESPETAAGQDLRSRFDQILVDEFQDANPVQYRLVRALASNHANLCVVGDDDQSIYRWRGADVRIIRGFKHDFPGTRIVKLEENYRSSANIVSAALSIIQPSAQREAKELYTRNPSGAPVRIVAARNERDEAAQVVRTIHQALRSGLKANEIAVFYRIHAQSRVLEEALRSENVPYQIIGGTRFFDRAEIKDLLAYLRILINPRSDVDLLRVINVPARGIGQATIDKLLQTAQQKGQSLSELLSCSLHSCGLSTAPFKRVSALAQVLEQLRQHAESLSPRALAEKVLEVTGYSLALNQEDTAEADARLQNLQEMLGSLQEYEDEAFAAGLQPSLSDYLERVSLVSNLDQASETGRVALMTVHAAKGLEFALVLLTGMEEDLFPFRSQSTSNSPDDIEEERRLGYVAVTRARQQLVITHAESRSIFGSTRYCRPSRFLADIPLEVVETAKTYASPPPRSEPQYAPRERYVERDVVDPIPCDEGVELARGTRVAHKRYGEGRVCSVETSTNPPVVVVFFPGWGEKKILATYLTPA